MTAPSTRLALPLGLITLAVYLALVPWTSRVWLRTGDEPHYLIAAHSLAYDGDLDLSNNYDPNVYLNWYTTADLGRQVRTRGDGAQFLVHTYGLPFLIAPVYRLAGAGGVPYFLAGLGALLAANVYLLAHQATGDWRASLAGWLVVAASPPLVWYVFLIYPEMAGALCVTLAVRVLLKGSSAKWGDYLTLGLALGALPWLSARFVPVMLTLAALAAWQIWRDLRSAGRSGRPYGAVTGVALVALSLVGFAIFNAVLYGNAAPTASYAGSIDAPNRSWAAVLQLARGLLGWLLDHQRGLLVIGPIYFVALVGLGQWLWRREWSAVVVAAPFGAAWFSIALFGGFWIGVEPAARYLVYVLPPLGASFAYAWAHRRGPWLAGLTITALAAGLLTAVEVVRFPLYGQTHDLIGDRLSPIVPYLPSLGRNIYLDPAADGKITVPGQDGTVRAPAGAGGIIFRQDAIRDFSFGWYDVRLRLGATRAPPDEPVARVLIQGGDNTRLLQAILEGRDFPADGSLRTFSFPIQNPVYNQWEQPPGMWIFATGKAELTLGQVTILPQAFHSLILPALWLAGLALIGVAIGSRFSPRPSFAARPEPGWLSRPAASVGLAAIVLMVGLWSLRPLPRTYSVPWLRHFTGTLAADSDAAGKQVLTARPEIADAAGVLASTRAQFYSPGRYVWQLPLKAGAAPPEAIIATARVYASRQPDMDRTTAIAAGSVPADGHFHTVSIEFDNPTEQALVFEVNYTAVASLSTDQFEVRAVGR